MKRRTFIKANLLTAGAFSIGSERIMAHTAKDLPKVVLLGDSIRKGYQSSVEKHLAGKADVWAPDENCKTTDNIIYRLHGYVKIRKPDIIHMNAGLHDIRTLTRESEAGEIIVKPAHYKDNLNVIFSWIRETVDCKIIWATTTPVVEERLKSRKGSFTRYNSDIQKINKIAVKVAKKYDVAVNDLYTYAKSEIGETGMKQDGVHFTTEANEKLGIRVTESIAQNLA